MSLLDTCPRGYHRQYYSDRDWTAYRGVLSLIVAHSLPGPIVDIGCGCGFLAEGARRWGWECVGLEASEEAITMAHELHPAITIIRHSLTQPFPLADASFQTAVMNQVIEHLEPPIAALAVSQAYRVLRCGGMLYIASPSRYNRRERQNDPTHINLYSPTALRELVSKAGFTQIVPQDSPREILGRHRAAKGMMRILHKLTGWDWLSASANCMAFKPDPSAAP